MRFETLHDILPADAREDRQVTLLEGEGEQRTLDFRHLRQRAVGVLGALQRRGLTVGDTLILCLADNQRFLELFWACVLGGLVPVPLAPGAADEHRRKLLRVFAQLDAPQRERHELPGQPGRVSVCIDAPALERLGAFAAAEGIEAEGRLLRSRALLAADLDTAGGPGRPVRPGPDDLAFIQYSSGSTGAPKGVLLTHRNLMSNIAGIIRAAAFTERDTALSWMPLSHDMGLIGFHLTMLACGISHVVMRTELFARRPLLWLEEASRRRTSVLCSPNFGYQHYLGQYARRHAHGPPEALDLSAVRLIFDGAEPISAGLCRRFVHTLAPHGLRPESLLAVYGLAEASLAVSFSRPGAPLATLWLARAGLQVGRPIGVAATESFGATEFVKVGWPLPGTEIRVCDAGGAVLGECTLGHVQIRGENVSKGYFGAGPGTALAPSADAWLATGDLGFLVDGQLVITGRDKDLVLINGQNYHPHDFERIAEQVAGIGAGRVAAAAVRASQGRAPHGPAPHRGGDSNGSAEWDTEALALFVLHRGSLSGFVPKVLALRRAVNQQTGVEVAQIVPVAQLPKTSSGKLQRFRLAEAFERGDHETVLAELATLVMPSDAAVAGAYTGTDTGADEAARLSTVQRLEGIVARVVPDKRVTPQTNLLEINLNSLSLARIHEGIEREFPHRIEVTDLFDYPTLEALGGLLDGASK